MINIQSRPDSQIHSATDIKSYKLIQWEMGFAMRRYKSLGETV